jgi:hypothetical protein
MKPGTRYTKDGGSIDVHQIDRGQVYYRKWSDAVTTQPAFSNLYRVPLSRFRMAVIGARKETIA